MDFRLSRHAEWEMNRRSIPLLLVKAVMDHPEQRIVDESCTGRCEFAHYIWPTLLI
jgi:hypothetical protein